MKFNLFTQVRKKLNSGRSFDTEKAKEFVLSSMFLVTIIAIFCLSGLYIFHSFKIKNEELNLASNLIDKLERKAQKGKLNKQKEVDYFHRLEIGKQDSQFENPKHEKELLALKSFVSEPSLKENTFISQRLKTLSKDQLVFETIEVKDIKGLKESTLRLSDSVSMGEKDLKDLLKFIERNQSGGPQRVFKEFILKKERLTPAYQTYIVDFTLIERKKA